MKDSLSFKFKLAQQLPCFLPKPNSLSLSLIKINRAHFGEYIKQVYQNRYS